MVGVDVGRGRPGAVDQRPVRDLPDAGPAQLRHDQPARVLRGHHPQQHHHTQRRRLRYPILRESKLFKQVPVLKKENDINPVFSINIILSKTLDCEVKIFKEIILCKDKAVFWQLYEFNDWKVERNCVIDIFLPIKPAYSMAQYIRW